MVNDRTDEALSFEPWSSTERGTIEAGGFTPYLKARLARERAAEDHLYGDKERFVTAAYRRKLEEDRKWEEEERLK